MTRLVVFMALSAVLAWISRASLTKVRSHGFYRFLAWECIVGLFVLNFRSPQQWFGDPLSSHQIISWFLMFTCIVPVVWGTHLLRTRGKAEDDRPHDGSFLAFEKTTQLVTAGVFKYIRHPMYSSLLLLAWGVFFKYATWPGAALALGATAFLIATAKAEEREDIAYFGEAYRAYMRNTRMFVPFVF